MKKIRRDDAVIVIAGKDKGKQGKVVSVRTDGRLFVSGINMIKKHQRPNPRLGIPGGVVEKEAPIQASNVAILNTGTNKADRIGFTFDDGKKQRVFKSTGLPVDV
ncbi:MAG: 50S ribosomal protein L24 [Candidatus Endonucleobacter sp. (ex Gigantidas childressi)]|nr:50S ribosomal protein L24 [Candidatus Endonucleobacter sp. (ex Gigantidas childressi)]